jgi:neural Wiskott-Aldrich syndrome protein
MSTDLSAPPPTYTQQDARAASPDPATAPQLLILPAGDTVRFQSGFLGADADERAAIEGEVHLKGADARWDKLSVRSALRLRTVHTK